MRVAPPPGPAAAVLTAGLIEAVYAARVSVTIDPDGRPAVTPRRLPGCAAPGG